MKETLRYLAGIAGPNGYGSKTTADQVVRSFSSSPHHHLTAIITGATSGIGAETARVLAKRGVRLVIPARDRKKAVALKEGIEKENPKVEIFLFDIDLSSLASVKRFCTQFLALGLPLNILINNAGIFSQNLEFSEDKIEMTFATNYIDSLFFIASKLLKSTSQGASTSCYVALSPQAQELTGKYFADCNECSCSALSNDESEARRLWTHTRALIHRRLQYQITTPS
ncbi:tryptophan aminotransferase-related protein 2-like [Hibiscus syriacus]|uniref:Tryptophan aminotransferase-related protein 2-like n=1 Tax=Hibiscus syriacus TaxID=106335 RepID=A0A6A2Y1B9_HIBSY|nr:tryptophan aminotransferase-related protein 2-like [Hibiscus syriacus]